MMMSIVRSARPHDLYPWKYFKEIPDLMLSGQPDYRSLPPNDRNESRLEAVRTYQAQVRRDRADRQ